MQTIFRKVKQLENDMQTIKSALLPEEKVSASTLRRYRRALAEMRRGKEKRLEEIFQ